MPRQYTVMHEITRDEWQPYWRDRNGDTWQWCRDTLTGHLIKFSSREEACDWVTKMVDPVIVDDERRKV